MRFLFCFRFCSLSLSLQFLTFCRLFEPLPSWALMFLWQHILEPHDLLWRGRNQLRPLCITGNLSTARLMCCFLAQSLTHSLHGLIPHPLLMLTVIPATFILGPSQNISEHAGGGALLLDSHDHKKGPLVSDLCFLSFMWCFSMWEAASLPVQLKVFKSLFWVKDVKCLSLIPPHTGTCEALPPFAKAACFFSCHAGFLQNTFLIQLIVVLYI